MLTTNNEAKTRWCFAAVASHTDPRRGFHDEDHPEVKASPTFGCLGSRCMAWRHFNFRSGAVAEPQGYCGLAGRPVSP